MAKVSLESFFSGAPELAELLQEGGPLDIRTNLDIDTGTKEIDCKMTATASVISPNTPQYMRELTRRLVEPFKEHIEYETQHGIQVTLEGTKIVAVGQLSEFVATVMRRTPAEPSQS